MFPDCWKKVLIVPITNPRQNRHIAFSFILISRLSCLSEVYEYIFANPLKEFVTTNSIIIREQFGFRSKHSIHHQLWRLSELVHEGLFKKEISCVVFIDIAEAFNQVWHLVLIYRLIMQEVHAPQLSLIFWNYLESSTFSVNVNDSISSSFNIEAGVPQGSLVGTWLPNLYIVLPSNSLYPFSLICG